MKSLSLKMCLAFGLHWLIAQTLTAADLNILTENLPPFNMSDNGKNYARGENITGISTEIVSAACERAKINCKLTLKFPWKRIYDKALTSKNYAVYSTSRLPERENKFQWVGPLVEERWVLMARPDSTINLATLGDAKLYTVGGYQEDAIADYLEEKGLSVTRSADNKINIDKLMRGQLDLWATGSVSGPYFGKESGVVGLKEVLAFYNDRMWLAVNKHTSPDTVNALNQAIAEMKKDGTFERIASKYR